MTKSPPGPKPPPTGAKLHDAALAYLGRYAATEAGLLRVLNRQIDRWARGPGAVLWAGERESAVTEAATALRQAARVVVARLVEAGAVNDAQFAQARARSLAHGGRSARAIGAHLAARGVGPALAASSLPDAAERELAAAAIHAKRRRLGPFRSKPDSPEQRRREYGSFARAGFAQSVAGQVLRMVPDEAEALIASFRAAL